MCNTYIMKFVLLLACALSCIYIHCAYAEIVSVNLSYTDKVHFAVYEKLLKKNGMTAFFRPTKRFGVTWVFADARNTPIVLKGYIDAQMYTLECLSFKATTCTLTKSNDNIDDYKMKPARGRHLCADSNPSCSKNEIYFTNIDDEEECHSCTNRYQAYRTVNIGNETEVRKMTLIASHDRTECIESIFDIADAKDFCEVNEWIQGNNLKYNIVNDPPEERHDCGACPEGQYRNKDEIGCSPCNEDFRGEGNWEVVNGICTSTCSNPEVGEVYDPYTKTCHKCGVGLYAGVRNGRPACLVCFNGTDDIRENMNPVDNYLYQDEEGQTSCKVCQWNLPYRAGECSENAPRCHAGYMYVGAPKSPHRNICYRCSRGRYLSEKTRGETCKNCPQGFYRNANSATYCKQCPVGYTHTGRRQHSVTACKNGDGVSYSRN